MHVCNSFRVNQCGNEQFNKTQIKLVEKKPSSKSTSTKLMIQFFPLSF